MKKNRIALICILTFLFLLIPVITLHSCIADNTEDEVRFISAYWEIDGDQQ